jgi:hypothetical protein
VDLASIVMKYGTGSAPVETGKTIVDGDTDFNGINEIKACFTKAALQTLFASLGGGKHTVTVAIEGNLVTGGVFHGEITIEVQSSGGALAASISPNPLNPETTLDFTISKPGSVKVDLFDVQGRLVRSILNESFMAAGIHDVKIDGRGQSGEKLASGVYFVRGITADGVFKITVTILK